MVDIISYSFLPLPLVHHQHFTSKNTKVQLVNPNEITENSTQILFVMNLYIGNIYAYIDTNQYPYNFNRTSKSLYTKLAPKNMDLLPSGT